MNFADRLIEACRQKESVVVVGLDPRLDRLPEAIVTAAREACGETLECAAASFFKFGCRVIDAVAEFAVAVKPQVAFYEMLGPAGMQAYLETIRYARDKRLLVIADLKRGDIGTTAEAYADGWLGTLTIGARKFHPWQADAVTVQPYLGSDAVLPFIGRARTHGGGVFVLVKTSNPSSGELQDLKVDGVAISERVAKWLADRAGDLLGDSGYSSLGAVVGATYPDELARLRKVMPRNIILIPGYGAQGGTAAHVAAGFNADGLGAVVNASRSIIFAYHDKKWAGVYGPERWMDAVREAARAMRDELNGVRK
jgi:orotidine-5'-phosphate decarboxylase